VAIAIALLRFTRPGFVSKAFERGIDLGFEHRLKELAELFAAEILEHPRQFFGARAPGNFPSD